MLPVHQHMEPGLPRQGVEVDDPEHIGQPGLGRQEISQSVGSLGEEGRVEFAAARPQAQMQG